MYDIFIFDIYVFILVIGLANEYATLISSPVSSSSTTNTSTSTSTSTSASSNSSVTSDYPDVRILDEAMDLRVNVDIPPTTTHARVPGKYGFNYILNYSRSNKE